MAYTKTTWVNDSTALSADNLNKIEQGIYDAHLMIAAIYPVGCYFETTDASFDPNVTFGGTWSLEQEGLVHVSGSPSAVYPNYPVSTTSTQDGGAVTKTTGGAVSTGSHYIGIGTNQGAAYAHNHEVNVMQPYKNVFRWHRTA